MLDGADHFQPSGARSAEFLQRDVAGEDKCFLHSILCSLHLPRSRTAERTFERRSGRASLLIEAGQLWNGQHWIAQPIPYGPTARLLLGYVFTEAVRTGKREIYVGASPADLIRKIGGSPTGGQIDRGSYVALFTQGSALAACKLALGFDEGRRVVTQARCPIEQFVISRDTQDRQLSLWSPTLILSRDFLADLVEHAVPLDMRALIALRQSAFAQDLYAWLAYRLCSLASPTYVPWMALYRQFGANEYGCIKDFKKRIKRPLIQALCVYPDAKVEIVTGGLVLKPSRPPIAPIRSIITGNGR